MIDEKALATMIANGRPRRQGSVIKTVEPVDLVEGVFSTIPVPDVEALGERSESSLKKEKHEEKYSQRNEEEERRSQHERYDAYGRCLQTLWAHRSDGGGTAGAYQRCDVRQ